MKNIGKRALCLLFVAVLLLSMVALPDWNAQATEEQNQWPGHVLFDYDYTDLSGENKDFADGDAHTGWAKKFEGMNLTGSHKMNITIYDRGASQAAGTTITHKLCTLPAEDILIGQGYQTYFFTITVPTGLTSDLPYVYFVDSWGVNNPQMAKDLRTIEGRTVTLSISMKAEGTTTAATLYFDRMQITDTCEDNMSADGTHCTACGKTFDTPHLRYNYDYTSFAGGGNVQEISDADAYQGKAKIYTGVKLDAASTPLYRYEAGNPEFQYQYMKLGAIAKEDWKVAQGYQTYRFETVLPAEGMQGAGNTVYLTDNWTIQNTQMAKDLYAMAGKAVTIILSMKIEGELSSATVYVDRMQIIDTCEDNLNQNGTQCTVCGKVFASEADPSAHELFVYDFSHFNGTEVDDAEAAQGKAKSFSALNLTAGGAIKIYRYDPSSAEFSLQYLNLGNLPAAEILADQGYQTYQFEVTLPAEGMTDNSPFVYFTDNWAVQNAQMAKDLKTLAGRKVTLILSMKVTGDLTNATVYVDGARLVDRCEDHMSEDGTHCTACGKIFETEAEPSGHDLFIYDFSHFNGTEVDDAEAAQGKAKSFSAINLTAGGAIKIYRYDPSSTKEELHYLNLGNLPAAEILADQGYHTYQFEVTLPAEGMTDNAPFVYFTDNWAVQNAQMAKDLKTLAGRKVTLILSMKVTGDLTNATVYVDGARLVDQCEDHVSEDGTHCTVCGKVFETEAEPSGHDLFIYDFSHFNGTEVDDAEAAQGKAKSFSALNLTSSGAIKIYRYDPNGAEFALQYLNLGNLPAAKILADQGYQTYRFETTLPAEGMTDRAPFVYFTDNWAVQNAQMAKDLKTLAGQNIGILLSMKVTGDLTDATVYVDGARLIELCTDYASEDGTVCTKCGADLTTTPEPEPEPEDPIPEVVDFVYTADDFTLALSESNGDCVLEDSTSAYGKAAVLSYQTRAAATNNNEGSLNDLLRTGSKTQKLYIYGGDPAQSRLVNQFTVAQLQENAAVGEYVEYTVRDIDLIPTNHNYYFYMFDSWGFKLNIPSSHQKAIHNQGYVDVTISMKVTGNVANKKDPPTYYIDMISIKAAASGAVIHRHEYGEWTAEQLTHSATCAVCNKINTEFHKWDDGVVTKEYTGSEKGEKLFTCTVCGATKTEKFDNRVRFVFHADSFHLPTKPDLVANDSSSAFGMAAVMSYSAHKAYGNDGKALFREGNQRLTFYSYGGNPKTSYKIGELAVENLIENARGGKYVKYKFKDIKIVPVNGTYFLYMFDSWQFQLPLKPAQVQAMLGKRMDVFLSMKVTGRPNSTSNPVTYYIDEIIIQETSSEGDSLIPYVPKIVVPFTTLPAEYKAEDFRLPLADYGSGDEVVNDPTSAYGKAVKLSYEKRLAYNGTGKEMIRVPGQVIRLYTDSAILVGEFTSAELQANAEGGEYVVYEFKHQNLTGAKFMYMFDCWGFQIPMEGLTGALTDKLVDVKVSLKVTGDVTSAEENPPAYYIDYISITESEPIPEHEHVYENWVTDVLSHSAKCSVCSIKLEGFHVWDDGVVTREATSEEDGEIVYTCKICEMKDAKKLKKIKTETPVEEEPEPETESNFGLLIGVAAGGLGVLVAAAVIILLVVRKNRKKS